MFKWIEENHGKLDICIPNAGFSADKSLLQQVSNTTIKIKHSEMWADHHRSSFSRFEK